MPTNLISKDQLIEPFNIINEFQVKEIGKLDNYVNNISREVEILNGLDFDGFQETDRLWQSHF